MSPTPDPDEGRRTRVAAARAEVIEHIRPRAERELDDRRFDRLRPLRTRRLLVAIWAVVVVANAVVIWIGLAPAQITTLIAVIGLSAVLRRVVRGMADLPDELLDERMSARRNQVYRHAYVGVTLLAFVPALLLWIAADSTRIGFVLEARHLGGVTWLALGAGIGLPSAILAAAEPEL